MSPDEKYMHRALELARLGEGFVAPNPMVGAVVVHNDRIIGEGYHEKYGAPHAEVNAINSIANVSLLPESTIYVSLEPCAHHGKTPPCADLIISKKLKRVVIGCGDTFSEVNGKGIERLKNAGIDVEAFVLEQASRDLNKKFFTFHEKKRPYVILKWAESSNGYIDSESGEKDTVTWISQPEIQPLVHQLRAANAAILTGKNTILNDNPSLTVRAVSGSHPLRIILDSRCELPEDRIVFTDGLPTMVLNLAKTEVIGSVHYHQIKTMTPKNILNALHKMTVQSVLIEGGAKTIQSFLDAQLWDEAFQIIGQNGISAGTKAPVCTGTRISQQQIFGDQLNIYRL